MKSGLRFALLVFAGVTFLQAIWIVSVPPFRGIDEFDHVNRAAGVAGGEWRLDKAAADGRGLITAVPGPIVEAAQPQCDHLDYTGPDNCFPIAILDDGRVTIATAAGTYHPAYYAVIGMAARPFDGVAADYAMRITSALLCSFGIALAAVCWTWGKVGGWARFGFLVSLTPVLLYSTALPGPNGPEMIAGLILWSCLLRAMREDSPERLLLVISTAAATSLVTLRFLGPMWLGLVVLTWALWGGWASLRALLSRHWRLLSVSAAVVTVATIGAVGWTLQGSFLSEQEDSMPGADNVNLGGQPIVWALQIVAAFPLRNEVSHPAVYAIYILIIFSLVVTALIKGNWRERTALLGAVAVTLLLPLLISLLTMDTHGVIWQGRYGLPFSVGIPLMAGSVLSRVRLAPREEYRLVGIGCGLLGLAQTFAVATLVQTERNNPPSRQDDVWLDPSIMVIVAIVMGAWLVLYWATMLRPADRQDQAAERVSALAAQDVST